MEIETFLTITIKIIKLILNLIILLVYRYGYGGQFLGVGGTWNLNEDKNADAEIICSGVLVGYFIYTAVLLITYCFGTTASKKSLVDAIMNITGTLLFIAVGGVALHYWTGYQQENKYLSIAQEQQAGYAVGSLCIIEAALYLLDTVLTVIHFLNQHK